MLVLVFDGKIGAITCHTGTTQQGLHELHCPKKAYAKANKAMLLWVAGGDLCSTMHRLAPRRGRGADQSESDCWFYMVGQ